ncbi:MAG: PASTA domain-containing protein [Pseudomonadota bacterium]
MSAVTRWLQLTLLLGMAILAGCTTADEETNGPMLDNSIPTPDTTGSTQAQAEQAIRDAGLIVGTITSEPSDTVTEGNVVRTDPPAGNSITVGSTVNIILSSGTASVDIPDVSGLTQAEAEAAIIAAGLVVGDILPEASAVVANGFVIRTAPAAAASATRGSRIDLIISTGPADTSVPDVVDQPEATAIAALTNVGLVVGIITRTDSDVIAAGNVISQSPVGGTMVSEGSTVNLVISLGVANIAVPDTVGLSQAAAETAILDSGLTVGDITEQADVNVPAGDVISQNPAAGTLVAATDAVDLVVSLGPTAVPVPDIVGLSEAEARTVVPNAGLEIGVVSFAFSTQVLRGDVISQSLPPGRDVAPDTVLDFVVSLGPPVDVPNVTGLERAAAEAAIVAANLVVGDVTEVIDFNVPAGNVISQDPLAGTQVSEDTAVDLVVSLGPPTVGVPDVVGQTQAAASSAITGVGLTVGNVSQQASANVPAGNVISQNPTAGVQAIVGSAVDLVVSSGPPTVAVPDVVGQTQAAAGSTITGAGLAVGTVSQQSSASVPSGSVISQNPDANTIVAVGSAVDLVISTGSATTTVPNVVGQSQAAANTAIGNANLVTGTITTQSSPTVPDGDVISQNPAGGSTATVGSGVDLVVSSGPSTTTVPNVVGQSQAAANTAITNANLVTGTITTQSSATVPDGDVISQNPAGGTTANTGISVDLIVSSGPANVNVPNVVGQSQAAASNTITSANLVVGVVTTQASASVPSGDVISQNPTAGTSVARDSAVDFVVSSGPASVVVPDVVGMTQAAATTDINNVGLVVGNVTTQASASVPNGSVISQNPAGGASVSDGSAVDLIVSSGPAVDAFSDEFDSNSLSDWTLRHQLESTPAQYTVLDINQTNAGQLTIVPLRTDGWFGANDAPLIFKNLTGNFAVWTRVNADSVATPGQAPASDFNSAGLMARNPAGATGPENYVMLNIGRQNNSIATGVGSETKTTVNSSSTRPLQTGSNQGDLILCRVGDQFISYRFLSGDSGWAETTRFDRADLPSTLQVGMVVNAFSAPADLRATFEFIRLRPTPASDTDCTP